MSMLWMILIMLLAFMAMSRFASKQQKKLQDEQEARTNEAVSVPGTWVRTRAGFYGTVVEVDGDVVTLATPLGDESLWAKSAIVGAEEPPFASEEDEGDDEAQEPDAEDARIEDDPAEDAAPADEAPAAVDETPQAQEQTGRG